MKNSLTLIIFLSISSHIFSQNTFKGRVFEQVTKIPLSNVNILRNNNPIALTDSLGNFSFEADSIAISITFVSLGFENKTTKIFPNQENNFFLSEMDFELDEIIIKSFEENSLYDEIPASIGTLKPKDLERFSNTSLVSAMNTLSGVRMEERSPGSYRLSIRGSLLRSPFGVRNVKIYWNDIPFTDAGGNSYLNALDFNNIQSMEVIKGPAGSLYGAGTGGAVLLESLPSNLKKNHLQVTSLAGSYGLFGLNGILQTASEKQNIIAMFAQQEAQGYRAHSQMRRNMFGLSTQLFSSEKRILSVNFLYADLFYQTPGGLTLAQFIENPRQARPSTPFIRGAAEQNAHINLKSALLGVSQLTKINKNWQNRTAIYLTHNQIENPAIRNYERRLEPGIGGRTVTNYSFEQPQWAGKISFGAEMQYGFNNTKVFDNQFGQSDDLQSDDEIRQFNYTFFGQADLDLPANFYLTVGASYNQINYQIKRISVVPNLNFKQNFMPVLSPRIALLKKLNTHLSVFGSVSWGFSPPTIAELLPSTGQVNIELKPEQGISYELGIKGKALKNKFTWDIATYQFNLKNTIVLRRTEDGADFFVNTGNTQQQGIEATLNYSIFQNQKSFVQNLRTFVSYTYNKYTFENYVQILTDFSGNRLTGVAPHIFVVGLDLQTKIGLYTNWTFNYTDAIPLNDANTNFASGYRLLGGRLGYKQDLGKAFAIDIWTGADNL